MFVIHTYNWVIILCKNKKEYRKEEKEHIDIKGLEEHCILKLLRAKQTSSQGCPLCSMWMCTRDSAHEGLDFHQTADQKLFLSISANIVLILEERRPL